MSVKLLLLFFNLLALNTAFETQIIDSTINEAKTQSVNSSVQLIFHFRNVVDSGLRVYTYSAQADQYQPLIFTVRQEKGVVSWQIPFYVRRSKKNIYDHYPLVNRTLCPIDNHPKLVQDRQSDVFISVSTSSVHNISFEVLLHQQVKNSVKLCFHLSYIVQNSFHFDEIFHRKFQIPILVLSKKFCETLFTSKLHSAELLSF